MKWCGRIAYYYLLWASVVVSADQAYENVLEELKSYRLRQEDLRSKYYASIQKLEEASAKAQKLMDLEKELQERTLRLRQRILQHNSDQVASLSLPKMTTMEETPQNEEEDAEEQPPVSKEEMSSSLTWQNIGGEASDQRILRHFKQLLQTEYQDLHNHALSNLESDNQDKVLDEIDNLTLFKVNSTPSSNSGGKCVELPEAARVIGHQLQDHNNFKRQHRNLLWDASVVYSMTSESFVKSTWEWLYPYVPEDWERILKPNYQQTMPSYLSYHSSPTTVLSSNTNVGSCWPMKGSSGQITFLFTTPPSSITNMIVSHTSYTENLSSAPSTISLIGYPPCSTEDCSHLSFDPTKPITLLSHVQFQIEKEPYISSQLFPITNFSQTKQQSLPPQGASCTVDPETFQPQSSSSCGGDHSPIQALSIVIHENWGHPDYTCLYNIVIQGE